MFAINEIDLNQIKNLLSIGVYKSPEMLFDNRDIDLRNIKNTVSYM